jgi:hypothetical protein
MLRSEPKNPEPDLPCEVGYAWFFEKTVIYGSASDVLSVLQSRNAKTKHGQFISVVKTLIPVDPYYVLYTYLHDSSAFAKRQRERKFRRKMGITRLEARDQPKLQRWLRK